MRKVQFLMVVSCTALLSLSGWGTVSAQEKEIRIGLTEHLTGVGAEYGPKFHRLAELRMEEIGYKIAGIPVKLFVEDDATTATMATDKARKLIEVNKVHIITGAVFGHLTMAYSVVAAEKKIPHIIWAGGAFEATERGWSYSTIYPLETLSYLSGKWAYEKGYRTATCIGQDYVAGHRFLGGAMQGFIDRGGKVIQKQWVPLGTRDLSPYISSMKPADVCIFWFAGDSNLVFWKQYQEFGLLEKRPLIICEGDTIFSPWLKQTDPKLFAGKISGRTSYLSDLDNPLNKKFVAAFKAKSGGLLPDSYDLLAYESMLLVTNLFEATKGDTNPEKLEQAIKTIKVDTPAGSFRYGPDKFPIRDRQYIFQFANRGGETVKEFVKQYPGQELVRLRPGMAP